MALDYLKSSIDIEEQPVFQNQSVEEHKSKSTYVFKICVLAVLIAITGVFSYKLWKPAIKKAFNINWSFDSLKVTGIIHDNQNPMAIVDGKVVHKGDVIEGYTVCNIAKDTVEFNKNGKIRSSKLAKISSQ